MSNNVQSIESVKVSAELSERLKEMHSGWGGETLQEFALRCLEMGVKQIEYRKVNQGKQAKKRQRERAELREYRELKARMQKDPDAAIALGVLDATRGEVAGDAVNVHVVK